MTTPETSLAVVSPASTGAINAFGSESGFEVAQRMAKALSASTMVPQQYQGNIANCIVAIELASRIGCSVFQVCQNLDIIHGRPSWRATFLIGSVNACGRFSPLRFRYVGEKGSIDFGCYAVAKDRETGDECIGATITMAMAKAEGWSEKNGSKWKTMADQMLMYRAAAFWTRIYAPEVSLGMQTAEELQDTAPPARHIEVQTTVVADDETAHVAVPEDAGIYLARIEAATTMAELKALSREIAKLPASVGAELQKPYTDRKAALSKPQPIAHDAVTGEVHMPAAAGRMPGED